MLFYLTVHDISVIGKLLILVLIKWKAIRQSDSPSSSNGDELIPRNRMDLAAVITPKATMWFIQLHVKELAVFPSRDRHVNIKTLAAYSISDWKVIF